MFPYYWAIVIHGVQGVEEFTKVLDPASYLFPFDVCEGESGSSDMRLVCGDCPIQAEVEFEFVKEVICQGSIPVEGCWWRPVWSHV